MRLRAPHIACLGILAAAAGTGLHASRAPSAVTGVTAEPAIEAPLTRAYTEVRAMRLSEAAQAVVRERGLTRMALSGDKKITPKLVADLDASRRSVRAALAKLEALAPQGEGLAPGDLDRLAPLTAEIEHLRAQVDRVVAQTLPASPRLREIWLTRSSEYMRALLGARRTLEAGNADG